MRAKLKCAGKTKRFKKCEVEHELIKGTIYIPKSVEIPSELVLKLVDSSER